MPRFTTLKWRRLEALYHEYDFRKLEEAADVARDLEFIFTCGFFLGHDQHEIPPQSVGDGRNGG